ncbi:MAG TPA: 7TM-DISM domain-containing protein [Chryseosolibacter sp.]
MKGVITYIVCVLALPTYFSQAQHTPTLEKGVADFSKYNFTENGPVSLAGEWELYMSQLISPQDFQTLGRQAFDFVDFPSAWNASSGSQNFGFATYRLNLILPRQHLLAIQLPHCYSAYTLWANDETIAKNGVVATTREQSVPQWLPTTVNLPNEHDTISLVLQISNFNHAIGGIREAITLGTREDMRLRESISLTGTIILVSALTLLFIISFFVSALYKSRAVLLFSLLCLGWGVREAFSNYYLAIHYMPDFPWEVAVKIEYISLFAVMIITMLFVASLFKEDVSRIFKYLFCFCNVVFVLIAAFLEASIFTQFLPVYLSFAALLIAYILYVLVRAVVYERQGVWLIVACLFLGVIIFSYDLIAYQGVATFSPMIISIGYLTMFILLAIALLFQVGIFKRSAATNLLTYEDLYGGNSSM